MRIEDQKIEQLLTRKILGKINTDEESILNNWIASSAENKKEAEAYQQLWEKSKDLVYSDHLDIESALQSTKKRIPEFRKKKLIHFIRQAAAVLVISMSLSAVVQYYKAYQSRIEEEKLGYMDVKTAYGMQSDFFLPDGTQVWLNSGSELRYPKNLTRNDLREVKLKGEAYFKVTKDAKHPFIVQTKDIDVKVLGTQFNVSAYDDFESTTVALEEGKVSILKSVAGKSKELLVLNPNEIMKFNKEENRFYHIQENSLDKYTSWKKGILMFYGDPAETVVHRLEKWYNVEIRLADPSIKQYKFTATFENESLDQVLNLLSMSTPLKYESLPAKMNPDHSFSKRVIVISKK